MPRGIRAHGSEEVNLAEVRPVDLAEVELRVGALPEHEAGETLLPRGADDKVRIRLAARVKMLRDVLHVEDLSEFLDAGAPAGLLDEQRAHRISDLTPTSIPNRDVHNQAGCAGCGLGRVFQDTGRLIGQQIEGADGPDVPAVGGEPSDSVLDNLQEWSQFGGGPAQVVSRQ